MSALIKLLLIVLAIMVTTVALVLLLAFILRELGLEYRVRHSSRARIVSQTIACDYTREEDPEHAAWERQKDWAKTRRLTLKLQELPE